MLPFSSELIVATHKTGMMFPTNSWANLDNCIWFEQGNIDFCKAQGNSSKRVKATSEPFGRKNIWFHGMGERLLDEKFLDCSKSRHINRNQLSKSTLFKTASKSKALTWCYCDALWYHFCNPLKNWGFIRIKVLWVLAFFLKAQGITVVMFRNRDGTFSDLCVT